MRRAYPSLAARGFVDHRGQPLLSTPAPRVRAVSRGGRGGYNAGSRSLRMSTWTPAPSGPNAAFYGDLWRLVGRTRDAVRNNEYAKSAVRKFTSNAIGTGIIPRWRRLRNYLVRDVGMTKSAARDLSHRLVDEWDDWCDMADPEGSGRLDFYGQQALAMQAIMMGGEVLARMRTRPASRRLRVPLQIQVLEGDYLDESMHGDGRDGGHRRRLGVEFDRLGQRRAYWLRPAHPGDDVWGGSMESRRVPALEVAHAYWMERPGQVRGIPWLAPVLTRLQLLSEFEDATLVAQKTQAMFMGFVTSDPADVGAPVGYGDEQAIQYEEAGVVSLEPGTVQDLAPGEKIEFAQPEGVAGTFDPYLKSQLRAVAAGTGLTYEQMTGDLSGVNYSSIRAGLVEFRRFAEQVQFLLIIKQFCQPVMDAFLRHLHASGVIEMPGYMENPRAYHRVDWRPPGWEWVDPLKDVSAKRMAMEAKLESRTGVIAEMGYDREDVDQEIAEEMEDEESLGIQGDPTESLESGAVASMLLRD